MMSLIKKSVLKQLLKDLKQAYSIYYFRNIARMEESRVRLEVGKISVTLVHENDDFLRAFRKLNQRDLVLEVD